MSQLRGGEPTREKNSRLGRGISALLPNAGGSPEPAAARQPSAGGVISLAIEEIQPDRLQPRRHFDEEKIEELASSIRAKGVIQPILVRKEGNSYRIVAGERRWRASQRAGLKAVPALVKEVTERQAFELALIENIQREDLNAIEEAEAYRRLIDEFGLTQEACAERVGKDRSSIANSLRLLRLPDEVKDSLVDGSLNMGHARALLGLADDSAIRRAAAEVASKKLSVRQTEQLVRKEKASTTKPEAKAGKETDQTHVRAVEEKLQRALGTKVKLADRGKGRGRIEIEYFSYEELDRLIALLAPAG